MVARHPISHAYWTLRAEQVMDRLFENGSESRRQSSPLPVLTGVMQSPGGRSSAIFQINNASVSAESGEGLGSSGWTLASVASVGASNAVIRNNGQERTLSVGGVF